MMSTLELSMFVDMITEVIVPTGQKVPVFGFELHQIQDSITKFGDLYETNKVAWAIPQSKLDELNGYVTLFPSIKFGDTTAPKWTNNMIDALALVCELLPYIKPPPTEEGEIIIYDKPYQEAITLSDTLERAYTSFYAGHWNEFWNNPVSWQASRTNWKLSTNVSAPFYLWVGSGETWWKVDDMITTGTLHLKAYMDCISGGHEVARTCITVLFLSSGEPKPLTPFDQRESILTRGDKVVVGSVDYTFTPTAPPHVYDFEWYTPITINNNVHYIVVVLRDDVSGTFVDIALKYFSLTYKRD
jgi:hypothetical protein